MWAQLLSPAGLIADVAGFILLALDLWPEYQIYRLRRDNVSFHKTLIEVATTRRRFNRAQRKIARLRHSFHLSDRDFSFERRLDLNQYRAAEASHEDVRDALEAREAKMQTSLDGGRRSS